jgi:hypothetical protein
LISIRNLVLTASRPLNANDFVFCADIIKPYKKRFPLYFQWSAVKFFNSFVLKDERTIFLRNFSNNSTKITVSIPRCPESPETSLGRPQIPQIPALSSYCLQQVTLILTALLSHNVLLSSVWRGEMTNMKPGQIAKEGAITLCSPKKLNGEFQILLKIRK